MRFYPARHNDKLIGIMAAEIEINAHDLKREITQIENQIEVEIERRLKEKREGENERE